MTATVRLVLSVFTGMTLGVAVVFLTLVSAVAYAFATGSTAFIPGVLTAWFTTENDLPALNFQPNGVGLLVAVGLISAIFVGFAALHIRRAKRPPS